MHYENPKKEKRERKEQNNYFKKCWLKTSQI